MLTRSRSGRHHPLRIALLASRRAPGLEDLLGHPARGRRWDLVALGASDPDSELIGLAARAGFAPLVHDLGAFYRARGVRQTDLLVREAYDREWAGLLAPARPDVLVLTGYLHIVTGPLLTAFPGRIINVHDADLALRGPDGLPRYPGLHATRDAMVAGERETRLTAHVVTDRVDQGPLLVRSWAFPVEPRPPAGTTVEALRALRRAAWLQRDRMMREAWGPVLVAALDLTAHAGGPPAPGHAPVELSPSGFAVAAAGGAR